MNVICCPKLGQHIVVLSSVPSPSTYWCYRSFRPGCLSAPDHSPRYGLSCEEFADLRRLSKHCKDSANRYRSNVTLVLKRGPKRRVSRTLRRCWVVGKGHSLSAFGKASQPHFLPALSIAGKQAWQANMADCHPVIDLDAFLSWPLSVKGWGYFQRFPASPWPDFPAKPSIHGPLSTDQRLTIVS